jgi:hypothetical protein
MYHGGSCPIAYGLESSQIQLILDERERGGSALPDLHLEPRDGVLKLDRRQPVSKPSGPRFHND